MWQRKTWYLLTGALEQDAEFEQHLGRMLFGPVCDGHTQVVSPANVNSGSRYLQLGFTNGQFIHEMTHPRCCDVHTRHSTKATHHQ